MWERSGCNAWNAWWINTWRTKHITAAHLEQRSLLSDEGFCGLRISNQSFFFFFFAKAIWTAWQTLRFYFNLSLWFTCTFVAARQWRQAEQAEKHLNKMKHVKNVVWTAEKQSHGQRRLSACYFSPVLPQSSQSVKPGGRQGRHAFILDQHAMMLFFQLHYLCL